MQNTHPIRTLALSLACVVLLGGCVHTDTAVVRSSRPAMTAFNRTTEPTESQVRELVVAERLGEEGEYREAVLLLEQLLAQNPTMTDAYIGLGSVYQRTGDLSAAESNYARAARLEPSSYAAQLGHGTALQSLKRYSDAVIAYRRALLIDPMSVPANLGAAESLLALKRPESALPNARSAARLEPENVEVFIVFSARLTADTRHAGVQWHASHVWICCPHGLSHHSGPRLR